MNKPPIIFIAVIAVIIVLASQRFFKQREQSRQDDLAPVIEQPAQVEQKLSTPSPNRRTRQREVIAGETMLWQVKFSLANTQQVVTYRLTESQWQALQEGEQGILSTQGSRFVRFIPSASEH